MSDSKYDKIEEEDPGLENSENGTETQPEEANVNDDDSQPQPTTTGNGDDDSHPQPTDGNGDTQPQTEQADVIDNEDASGLKTEVKDKQDEPLSSNYTRMTSDSNNSDVKKTPSTFMVLSILSFIFFPVFLGLNIILSYMVTRYTRRGNVKDAKITSQAAFQLNVIGFLMGILVYTAILGYYYYVI